MSINSTDDYLKPPVAMFNMARIVMIFLFNSISGLALSA
jgi:hypothetical protein